MRKRNKILMMAISSLLCLTLISSCLVSSIFSKYVTEDSVGGTVAFKKWGVTITADVKDGLPATVTGEDGSATVTISGLNMKPGDDFSDAIRFTITGTPEVKCRVTVLTRFSYGSVPGTSAVNAMQMSGTECGYPNEEFCYFMPVGLTFGTGYYNSQNKTYTPTVYGKDANNNDLKYTYISEPWRYCVGSGVPQSECHALKINNAFRDTMYNIIDESGKISSSSGYYGADGKTFSNGKGIYVDFAPNSGILFYPKGQTHSETNKMNSLTFGFHLPYEYSRVKDNTAVFSTAQLDEIATYMSEHCNESFNDTIDGKKIEFDYGKYTFSVEYIIMIDQIK